MRRTFASLRKHHNYRLYFAGQIVSLTGTWMQNVALAWFVVQLTHSPVAVGLLAFCRFVPFTLFGLVSGVVADRFDTRRLVMMTQAVAMLVSVALAFVALSGMREVWLVYVLAAAGGVTLVFDAPARHSLTFQLVGRDELSNAVALNSSLFNASRVIGPSIAGVVVAAAGVGACFVVNAVSFLAVLAALGAMRARDLFAVEREERPTVVRGVREGLAYVRREPHLRLVILMTLVISTVGFNFHVLIPVLASDTLHAGPRTFGVLSAAFGAGALGGALTAATIGRASWKVLLTGIAGFGAALLVLAPLTAELAAGALLFATGLCFTLWQANSQSILQLGSPDHLRGRVLSLYLFAFGGLAPVGGVLSGWLSEVGGTALAFTIAGAAALAMTAYALVTLRRVGGELVALPERRPEEELARAS